MRIEKINVALIQHSFKGNKGETIEHTISLIEQATKNIQPNSKVDLVVLQELHTSKYFCQSEDVKFFAYAREFQNEVNIFSKVARNNNIVLVTSLFEQRAIGLYHNTAVVFERDGSIAGKYRKMHIPDDPGFYEKFYFTPGDNVFKPIKTSLGNLGVLICWDQWYPEAARLMTLNGADILIYPTAIGFNVNDNKEEKKRQLDSWITIQRSHAIANGVFVLSTNRCGLEIQGESKIDFWGNSFIAGTQGEILAQAGQNEAILCATLDLNRIYETRNIWPFLRDRRIEFYNDITRRYID